MRSQRWQSVFAIFEDMLEASPSERGQRLDSACGGDKLLRRGVEELLDAHRQATLFLDRSVLDRPALADAADARPASEPRNAAEPPPAAAVVAEAARREAADGAHRETASDLPFATIGPYRILRRIGQGGMSTVYLAVRDDDAYRRRMVVKVVRSDMQSETMLQRLRAERQILASLEHPYIARLYDGGSTAQGIPYFVMEFVEGVPIDRYCDQQQLSVEDRLALFGKVCVAVEYAHQNLVVHRDIKPSNILVTAEGDPKLLDFGIAKLLNPGMAGPEIEPTAAWQRLMTPSFASPEQIRGELITTVSDVYSLGVLLYVLLTGRLPHLFEGRSLREIERLLTDTEPRKPSQVATGEATTETWSAAASRGEPKPGEAALANQSRRTLEGDVDAIVLKALRSAPSQRYPSVGRFSADIERFLSGLPVEARAGTWRYRAGKFVRRQRKAVAVAVTAVVMLSSFAVAMALQARRVTAERDKKARVVSLFRDVFELSNPFVLPGAELTVREALARSLPLLEDALRDQPEVRAELLHTTGSILSILGAPAKAAEQLSEALAIRQEVYGPEHPEVAETLGELATARRELLELDEAESLARRAVAATRRRVGDGDPALIQPLLELAAVYCYKESYSAAKPLADEVLALTDELSADSRGRITALEVLAQAHSSDGEYAQALEFDRQALELSRARFGEEHPRHIPTLISIGLQLRRLERFEASEKAYAEALELQRKVYGEDFVDPVLLNNLAGVRYAIGNYASAESLYREAHAVVLERIGAKSWKARALKLRIIRTRIHQDAAAEAEQEVRRLLADDAFAGDDLMRSEALSILGEALSAQERCRDAEPLLVDSYLAILEMSSRVRIRDDAFQRLRVHLERCEKAGDVARYEAMLRS